MEPQKVSDLFFNNIKELPLWVKQIVHLRADAELKQLLEEYISSLNPQGLLQQCIPKITYSGREELKNHKSHLTREQAVFLMCAAYEYDLFEIALTNFWSLEQVCKYYTRLAKVEFVELPICPINASVMHFLAGTIKTGDVLKKLGKINAVQIGDALKVQKEKEAIGLKPKMAEILVELGYVKKKDVDILLKFKDEAKKRFVMGLGLSTIKLDNGNEGQRIAANMQRELKRLSQENMILKERLKKILNLKG